MNVVEDYPYAFIYLLTYPDKLLIFSQVYIINALTLVKPFVSKKNFL